MKTINKIFAVTALTVAMSSAFADAPDASEIPGVAAAPTVFTYVNGTDSDVSIFVGQTQLPPSIVQHATTPFTMDQIPAVQSACGASIATGCEVDYYITDGTTSHKIASATVALAGGLMLKSATVDDPNFTFTITPAHGSATPITNYTGKLVGAIINLSPNNAA